MHAKAATVAAADGWATMVGRAAQAARAATVEALPLEKGGAKGEEAAETATLGRSADDLAAAAAAAVKALSVKAERAARAAVAATEAENRKPPRKRPSPIFSDAAMRAEEARLAKEAAKPRKASASEAWTCGHEASGSGGVNGLKRTRAAKFRAASC